MKNFKDQYDKIVSERKELIEQINSLAGNETVKKYFELCDKNNKLEIQQKNIYKQMKAGEYSSCKHVWVNTSHEYDSWEGRSYNYYGCVKCGLDQRVFQLMEIYRRPDLLTSNQRIMYDYMSDHLSYNYGINTELFCDLDLARAIYSKIMEAHPSIDDETAVKYLKVALHNIRDAKASEERNENRAKRLSLKPKFRKWYAQDVCARGF